jgi:hypothetical protein
MDDHHRICMPINTLIAMILLASAPLLAAEQPPTPVDKEAVRVPCETTSYVMQPGQTDQAVILKDPAGQQTVLFDIKEGGAIVSLKYRGNEHIWGHHGGALLQMAFHHETTVEKLIGESVGDYNPTQAGDGTAPSPVTGLACHGTSSIDLVTLMLDYNHNNAFFRKPVIAVCGGRVNGDIPVSYFTPYALETRAHWVRSRGAGGPKYYLQLDERITHLTQDKVGPFMFDFADYAPWEFDVSAISPENCPCSHSSTSYIAAGWYRDKDRSSGLAVAMPSLNFLNGDVKGSFISDYTWRNRSLHLESDEALDGITSKRFSWYVMAGPWRDALDFARYIDKSGAAP